MVALLKNLILCFVDFLAICVIKKISVINNILILKDYHFPSMQLIFLSAEKNAPRYFPQDISTNQYFCRLNKS